MEAQYFPIHTKGMKDVAARVLDKMPLPCEITIQPYRQKRSQAQNRLYWLWITEISRQIEVPNENGELKLLSKEEWHHVCGMKWLGVKTIRIGKWETAVPGMSTKKLKVGEFAEYLTAIESHFLAKGAVLTFPDDYSLAKGATNA